MPIECSALLKAEETLQGVDRRRFYRGGPHRVRRGGGDPNAEETLFFPRLVGG
jgi:hypothetical protein